MRSRLSRCLEKRNHKTRFLIYFHGELEPREASHALAKKIHRTTALEMVRQPYPQRPAAHRAVRDRAVYVLFLAKIVLLCAMGPSFPRFGAVVP